MRLRIQHQKKKYYLNQLQWTYTGNYGRAYEVGVAHGEQTGHLVVYCNASIIVIDFNVLQSKKYSFFIDGELVDLSIEKIGNSFEYECQINTDAKTPLNEKRRQSHQEEYRLIMGGLIIVLAIVLLLLRTMNASQ